MMELTDIFLNNYLNEQEGKIEINIHLVTWILLEF